MADINLEEANRIRVAMGLKPIETGPLFKGPKMEADEEAASTLETRSAQAEDNFRKVQEEKMDQMRRKSQREAIKKAKDAAMRHVRMTGKTLGEEDQDQDTATWLRQQRSRQKRIEQERLKEEEDRRKEKRAEYTAQDLAGVQVGHEFSQFENGDEQILTLKDATIGEESEDDELENIHLREQELLKDKLELKKRKPIYNPNDDDGTGENKILARYDEAIEGKKQHRFTLDEQGNIKERLQQQFDEAKSRPTGIVISLNDLKEDRPISDYQEAKEVKIRKPKKKRSKSLRKKNLDDDDDLLNDGAAMGTDKIIHGAGAKKRLHDTINIDDDEDLQLKLARQKRDLFKKRARISPEDLAHQLRGEQATSMDGLDQDAAELAGLVFDETSEFVSHIETREEREEDNRPLASSRSVKAHDSESGEDVEMNDSSTRVHFDDASISGELDGIKNHSTTVALEEEGTMENGIGTTLSMLRQRRHLDESKHGDASALRSYQGFLASKRTREEGAEREARRQREIDRQSDYYRNMSAKDREELARKHNNQREQHESRAVAELFNQEYKPNVQLKYIDEFGRSMNQKEAFKHLSHHFHGKGSGKQKHEKRLKKIEEEKKREAMSALDSSQHVSSAAMGNKAKKNQQAGVRLQ